METQLTADFVFEMSIGYYKDISYYERASACDGGEDHRIVNSTSYGDRFSVDNIVSLEDDRKDSSSSNFWLTQNNQAGPHQGFLMDLGCQKAIVGIRLKNTHNAHNHNRGTKRFRLLGSADDSADGSWETILEENLEDSSDQTPPPTLELIFQDVAVVRFVKFEMLEFWGEGGGLQHFAVILGNDPSGVRFHFEKKTCGCKNNSRLDQSDR